jgi:hypothetical protein
MTRLRWRFWVAVASAADAAWHFAIARAARCAK